MLFRSLNRNHCENILKEATELLNNEYESGTNWDDILLFCVQKQYPKIDNNYSLWQEYKIDSAATDIVETIVRMGSSFKADRETAVVWRGSAAIEKISLVFGQQELCKVIVDSLPKFCYEDLLRWGYWEEEE